ncbi:MAG: BREX protein BrxB domain-containing protein [Polyangiaceae bacterium]
MTDQLDAAFAELRDDLLRKGGLDPTHSDPFFTFVHDPTRTVDVAERIAARWRGALERDGFHVDVVSLREILWKVVDASDRWEEWLEIEQETGIPGDHEDRNRSMRDLLSDDFHAPEPARIGLIRALIARLQKDPRGARKKGARSGRRLVLLTDMAHVHPWLRVDSLSSALHDKIACPTVLFYPGSVRGQFGLRFLGYYPEDTSAYRTKIVGGL